MCHRNQPLFNYVNNIWNYGISVCLLVLFRAITLLLMLDLDERTCTSLACQDDVCVQKLWPHIKHQDHHNFLWGLKGIVRGHTDVLSISCYIYALYSCRHLLFFFLFFFLKLYCTPLLHASGSGLGTGRPMSKNYLVLYSHTRKDRVRDVASSVSTSFEDVISRLLLLLLLLLLFFFYYYYFFIIIVAPFIHTTLVRSLGPVSYLRRRHKLLESRGDPPDFPPIPVLGHRQMIAGFFRPWTGS